MLTRKRKNKMLKSTEVTKFMLELLMTVKLYHWNTKSYSTHKATDDLYSSLNDNIDKFIEVYMGTMEKHVNLGENAKLLVHTHTTPERFKKYILRAKTYLEHIKLPQQSTDLYNIRDEILGDINKFIYLLSLN